MRAHLLLKSKTSGFVSVSSSYLVVMQSKEDDGGGEGGEGGWKTLMKIEVFIR